MILLEIGPQTPDLGGRRDEKMVLEGLGYLMGGLMVLSYVVPNTLRGPGAMRLNFLQWNMYAKVAPERRSVWMVIAELCN